MPHFNVVVNVIVQCRYFLFRLHHLLQYTRLHHLHHLLLCTDRNLMFARLNQLSRHLSRPLPNYLHNSAASAAARPNTMSLSAASAAASERSKRTINTAACLIIGDEVLGGKVCHNKSSTFTFYLHLSSLSIKSRSLLTYSMTVDGRHQLSVLRQILLLSRHQPEENRSDCR